MQSVNVPVEQRSMRPRHASVASRCAHVLLAATLFTVGTLWHGNAWGQQLTSSQTQLRSEYKLKVAYIFNFTRYVTWPEEAFSGPNAPFVIGVLGQDPLGRSLDQLASKKRAQGRPIVIQRFRSPEEYTACHIMFVAASSSEELRQQAIDMTRGRPVLVVGETPGYASEGATVAFFRDPNGTIGLRVNVDAVQQRGLKADAKLLKISSVVRGKP